jgi:hypothetical protein
MSLRQLVFVLAVVAVLAAPQTPWAGELDASPGFPQLKEAWHNDVKTEKTIKKMTVEVSPVGGAACTVSVSPGGASKTFDTDKGKPQVFDVTVPPDGRISITASASGVAAKGKPAAPSRPTCKYSVTESKDLSQ